MHGFELYRRLIFFASFFMFLLKILYAEIDLLVIDLLFQEIYQFINLSLANQHCYRWSCVFLKNLLLERQLKSFFVLQVSPELFVDTTRHQKLKINIDIILPKLPCVCE